MIIINEKIVCGEWKRSGSSVLLLILNHKDHYHAARIENYDLQYHPSVWLNDIQKYKYYVGSNFFSLKEAKRFLETEVTKYNYIYDPKFLNLL